MWNTEVFSPSVSQAVKDHYEREFKNLEAELMIAKPTEQELLLAKQHVQWLYDKSELHYVSNMLLIRLRIQSLTMCLRLSQDGEIQSITGTTHKASKLEGDTDGQSDAREQFPIHEVYMALLMCDHSKENDPTKRTTRSVTRLRSRNFPEPTTVSDVESDDSEVDMGKLKKGPRAASSPSDAA